MRSIFVFVAAFLISGSAICQNAFFERLQTSVLDRDERAFLSLSLEDPITQRNQTDFIRSVFAFPYETGVIRLAEEKPDRLILHVFLQGREEARFESWVVYMQKDADQQPRIRTAVTINAITGLYRLRMSDRPYRVSHLQLKHIDAVIHFQSGHIFPIYAGSQMAGILFIGQASFEFEPTDSTERQQVTLFAKQPRLKTEVTKLFIRSSTGRLEELLQPLTAQDPQQQQALYDRAETEARQFDRNVYSVRIPFTEELWFAQMEAEELYCEMKTSHGTLVYQHSPSEPDNVMLMRKDKEQIISLYDADTSINPPDTEDEFKILSYKMKMRFQPTSTHLSAVTEVKLESSQDASSIIFRLNPDLRVSQIRSSQGYLIYFQERKTNNLHLVLNETMRKGDVILLEFFYQGRIAPEKRSTETMLLQGGEEGDFYTPPTYLYSNQSNWYPQLTSRPYSAVETSITVPEKYAAVLNGVRTGMDSKDGDVTYSYKCSLPAKYFTLFVGRLDSYFRYNSIVPIDVYFLNLDRNAAKEYATEADKILRFYSNYFGAYPYQNFSIVLRPIQQPGGHAPATFAIVNRVFKFFQKKFAKDPLYIPEYPHFLLAHEIAHQWWGQSVGWKTYRDQWLSEGFAQFAAWEYMREQYGEAVWKKLADIFQDWVVDKSYAGPLILGARLGHITEDPQAFTALLYNKGAFTLKMLKNWMGDETFTRCMVEFFESYQFRKAGVDEFTLIAQKHSEEDLQPFFNQWLLDWDVPDIRWSTRVEDSRVTIQFQQKQTSPYQMRIPVLVKSKNGDSIRLVAAISEKSQQVEFDGLPFTPSTVEIDPLHETLMKTGR